MFKEIFYKWKLKNHKNRALFEIKQDLKYLVAFKSDMLNFDEGVARRRMAELKAIVEKNPKEELELDNILNKIAQSKAVKNEFEKSNQLVIDLENYISLL